MEPKTNLLAALPADLQSKIQAVTNTFKENGYECYLVGGVVRDLLISGKAKDIDFTTNARPDTVQKLFRRVIPTGIKHGTVTVLYEGEPFEVTTYRAESMYSDARRPDSIQYSDTLEEDLKRRDFTMNALACDALTGDVIDLFDGMGDIEKGLIRTIGDPQERFFEDGLRTVRACRFAATLGFTIEEQTFRILANPDIHTRAGMVAIERFTDELNKGFAANCVSRMIRPLEESGLRRIFLPDLTDALSNSGGEQVGEQIDLSYRASVDFRLALWFYHAIPEARAEISFPEVARLPISRSIEKVARDLKLSNHRIKDIILYHFYIALVLEGRLDSSVSIRRMLSVIKQALKERTEGFLQGIAELSWNEGLSARTLLEVWKSHPLIITDLAIDGQRLQQMGYRGRAVGQILEGLLMMVLEDPSFNTGDALESLIAERFDPPD